MPPEANTTSLCCWSYGIGAAVIRTICEGDGALVQIVQTLGGGDIVWPESHSIRTLGLPVRSDLECILSLLDLQQNCSGRQSLLGNDYQHGTVPPAVGATH